MAEEGNDKELASFLRESMEKLERIKEEESEED